MRRCDLPPARWRVATSPQFKWQTTASGTRMTRYLYTLTISLAPDDAGMEDEVSLRFGFREVSTRDGKILLNGEPIYLLSALDQDMYPTRSTQFLPRSSSAMSSVRPRSWA